MLRGQKATTEKNDAPHPSPQSRKLAARSCRGCHQRKIRCDRAVPCTNCSRCGIVCVYPTKESDMARRGGPTLQSISNRLERLEVLLARLAEDGQVTTRAAGGRRRELQTQVQFYSDVNINGTEAANQHPSKQDPGASTWELLLNEDEVVQYANNSLPENEDQVRNPQSITSGTNPSHIQNSTKAHHTPHAQPNASSTTLNVFDVLDCYPDTQLALRLWNVYVKSVDPVLKILHIPTVQSTVVETILDPKSAQSSVVALTYAIYFAAVTALCHDEDDDEPTVLPCEKPVLLEHYKKALDQLLMPTELMKRPELVSLQALAIYATCLRVHEVGRSVWVLNGLAIRLAQSIGLHRDGASLQLSPFDTEIRLRLWWHLCVLDSRAPEDQGFQPTVDVMNRGLRLPLNVNDNQIYPGMTHLPVESQGWTEMSFFLIQTDSCRLLHPILSIQEQYSANAFLNITETRNLIHEHGRILMAKYGMAPCDAVPTDLSRIAFQHTAIARKKMEFVLQLREEITMRKKKDAQDDAISDVHKQSFKLACDALECSRVLLKEGMTSGSGFQWFFKMYTQWYALAYVLRCLCSSPRGPETERAWTLVEELFPLGMNLDDEYGHGSIWSYLNLLRSQALSLRQHAQRRSSGIIENSISSQNPSSEFKVRPSTDATTTATATTPPPPPGHNTSNFPELVQELMTDPNQTFFSSLDLSMPEFPFLPDWNAIINGCFINDITEIDASCTGNYPADAA